MFLSGRQCIAIGVIKVAKGKAYCKINRNL